MFQHYALSSYALNCALLKDAAPMPECLRRQRTVRFDPTQETSRAVVIMAAKHVAYGRVSFCRGLSLASIHTVQGPMRQSAPPRLRRKPYAMRAPLPREGPARAGTEVARHPWRVAAILHLLAAVAPGSFSRQ